MVALDLLASGKFKFPENEFNVSPISKSSMKFYTSEMLSLTTISEAAGVSREEAADVIQNIFTNFV